MKRRKVCARGHVFYKSSDCPTCPTCEAAKRPALQGAGLMTLAKLAKKREAEVGALHGMGPNALGKLRASLKKAGLSFRE